MNESIPRRECSKCKNNLPRTLEYWYANTNTADGLNTVCKECVRSASSQWYKNHREYAINASTERSKRPEVVESRKIRQRARYHNDPVFHEKALVNGRKTRQNPRVKQVRREIQREYRKRPEVQLAQKEYLKKPSYKASRRAANAMRRARIKEVGGVITRYDVLLQFNSQKGRCWWCECKLNETYHLDHLIPIARGGTNSPNNIVCSCAKCNMSRQDKLPHEWCDRLL